MIQVYYGDGKGKTTALIGAAVRAAGSGMQVLFLQFLKNGDSSECAVLENIAEIHLQKASVNYRLMQTLDMTEKRKLREEYNGLLQYAAAHAAEYGMIVLDEALDALALDVLDRDMLFELLQNAKAEILLSGHRVLPEILALSDYASEVKMIKHPYTRGVRCRRGIEY